MFGFASLFRAYGRLIIFAAGLLLGIQVPSFIDQYEKRVDAHRLEASASISGFQSTADLLFDGDLEALIAYYERSDDEVFERDSASVRLVVDRYNRIMAETAALENGLVAVALHVLVSADDEFFAETVEQYSYTVPLNSLAIQWGLLLAILLTLISDMLFFSCVKCGSLMIRQFARGGKGLSVENK